MYCSTFAEAIQYSKDQLDRYGASVDAGSWQGYPTRGRPDLVTKEYMNLTLEVPVNDTIENLQQQIIPNLPWADRHFSERVSRTPSNPGEAYKEWPWWQGQEREAMIQVGQTSVEDFDVAFSHTYQERFWPKYAGQDLKTYTADEGTSSYLPHWGIRYQWGDLDDVVKLLGREPLTRQATFPIFFPEDTGVVHRGRVPCTLHYHFLLRNGMLHMWYAIRSCDYIRHFRDDLYLAARLLLWVLAELKFYHPDSVWTDVTPGHMFFTAYSFHMHAGDAHHG